MDEDDDLERLLGGYGIPEQSRSPRNVDMLPRHDESEEVGDWFSR